MNRNYIYIFLLMLLFMPLRAQYQLSGTLVDAKDEAIPFANVGLLELEVGASTDEKGFFELKELPKGTYTLKITALGYKQLKKEVKIGETAHLELGELSLEEDLLGLEDVVVTGTMKETFVSESPVKIDVYSAKYLENTTSPTNLMEALTMINGVQEVVACGVCYTNSISINGLPGQYAAILIDGTPAYGNLASVYGLNGIPSTIVDRIEVIKGPNSTLYGSEAVAGVINIITKSPEKQPILAVDVMGTSHLEAFTNLSIAPKIGKFNGLIGLQHAYINDWDDFNEDGFGDNIGLDRLSVFSKWSMDRPSNKKFTLFAKYYYEDRRNGVEQFMRDRAYRDLRGDTAIYGESIYTHRFEAMGTYELATAENIRLDYSFSAHDQDSYYGSDHYVAKQYIGYVNGIWNREVGSHDLMGGLTLRYQYYDDNTIATSDSTSNQPDHQYIPGIWLQDEWTLKDFTILGGMRLDYYQSHNLIPSPRLAIKYKPNTWWTMRMNLGTGFRIVNLFAEDHAFITGNREVVIAEQLQPERSYSGVLNVNHVFSLGSGQGTIDLDGFYTYFNNAIFPDYDQANQIVYRNLEGHAETRGVAMTLNYSFPFPLAFNVGAQLQQSFETQPDDRGQMQRADLEFAPAWSGVATINYNWKKVGMRFAYTANLTGPMRLPEVYDLDANGQPLGDPRPEISKPFSLHNIQVSKDIPKADLQIYLGIQNLFNYRQAISPLVGFNDPNAPAGFSDAFDTAYAYSPLHGRELYLGLRWKLAR